MSSISVVKNGTSSIHIAMFPWLPFGHVNPFIQLSNQLAANGYTISFLTTRDNLPKIEPHNHFPDQIHIVPLDVKPPPPFPAMGQPPPSSAGAPPPADSNSPGLALLQLILATDSLEDEVESQLALIKPDIIIYEFAHYIPAIANRLGIKSAFYCVTSATAVAYHLVPACQPKSVDDLTHPPPGHPPSKISLQHFEAQQFMLAFARFGGGLTFHERITTAMSGSDLIIMKTSKEMESKYCNYIKEQYKKPLVLAGLSLPEPETDDLEDRWESWLGQFAPESVLYVSFGSQDVLSKEQITELVLGLEESGVPFMAVLKFPGDAPQEEILPEGFTERVKGRGLIHSGWVRQQLLLSHKSVGGYLSHSGFGSLAEAMSSNCQLVLLPMKGDQFLNARLMSRDLKIGVEVPRDPVDGKFTREDVCKAVKSLMVEVDGEVGKEIRGNHAKLRDMLLDKETQSGYLEQVLEELEKLAKGV
uniref:Glycosyltransferase n=1 Tax=Epimedium koreanum TaxID=63351 RepID=A0A8B0H7I2_9MAGN|nr:flavonoid 3-O-rhamnosyltransferase [Epimedium koreanum]